MIIIRANCLNVELLESFGQSSLTPIKELGITVHMQPDVFSVRDLKVEFLCAVDVCDRLQH